ncbi:ABC transporter permease [Bacillus sp. FJAT-49711]|uniref:ABC transporter permease n=1 Tax=Bacillus sp. FJAT-49711 TaxID=2833585 RepID=UPI001BC8E106|nr:ABC transporter permease [Bacillus sp. FJAT-49711]MBS4219241.1 ABC transporter permease [Bacillus sp. FJAT-49711]
MTVKVLLKRVGTAAITIVLATILTFLLLRLTPGNAIDQWAREYSIQYNISLTDAYERIAAMINYNPLEPIYHQFVRYVSGLAHGNLGYSMVNQGLTVNEIIAKALPWTLFVSSVSLVISFVIGIFLGVKMAWKRNSILEPIVSLYSVVTNAVPDFIFAIILLIIFAYGLGWFPINGAYDFYLTPGFNLPFLLSVVYYAALPILTYVITLIGGWALMMKGSAVGVLGEDYVEAARARGISESRIMDQYVKKNAIIPLVTQLAVALGAMLGGAILIENLFQYPGIGYYMAEATKQRDYTVMQGILLFIAITMVVANLISDLIYSKLDPRIKVEE